jgi:multidrug efflux pump
VLIPVVAIPLSLIGAIFLMQVFGFTINLLTLLAIVLSVGLVVDDAIVVVENVERHLAEGLTPLNAALIGARELVGPIIAMTSRSRRSTPRSASRAASPAPSSASSPSRSPGAVTISGVVALTLSPMMCANLLRSGDDEKGFAKVVTHAFEKVRRAYTRLLDFSLAEPGRRVHDLGDDQRLRRA